MCWIAEQFIKNGQRLPRDPNAPKPKNGAYMYYAQEQRQVMAAKPGPKLDFQAAGTVIGT